MGEQLHPQNVPFSVCQPQQFDFLHCLFFGEVSLLIKARDHAQLAPFLRVIEFGNSNYVSVACQSIKMNNMKKYKVIQE